MTENEIIQYMKDNRKNGIIFALMPQIIQNWCIQNENKLPFEYFNNNQLWINIKEFKIQFNDIPNGSFSLPEDFELKKEVEGEWVEFKIREDGYFNSDIGLHLWFDWQKFLKFSYNQDIGFTTFGGWQYDEGSGVCKTWYMQPMVFTEVGKRLVNFCLCDEQEKGKPAIPVKIRFWRISK